MAQIAAETETDQAPAVERVRQTGVKTIAEEGLRHQQRHSPLGTTVFSVAQCRTVLALQLRAIHPL